MLERLKIFLSYALPLLALACFGFALWCGITDTMTDILVIIGALLAITGFCAAVWYLSSIFRR